MTDINYLFNLSDAITPLVKAIKELTNEIKKGFAKMELQTAALVTSVSQALATLNTEVQEVAEALANAGVDNSAAQAVVDEQVTRLNAMSVAISNIIPNATSQDRN